MSDEAIPTAEKPRRRAAASRVCRAAFIHLRSSPGRALIRVRAGRSAAKNFCLILRF
jgi:hypothetical protein